MSKKHIVVNFIIQKLKCEHIFLKKYTNCAKLSHVTQYFGIFILTQKFWAFTVFCTYMDKSEIVCAYW